MSMTRSPAQISDPRFEPPDAAKGEVARAALYMAATYPRRYRPDPAQRRLFEAWDAAFPVSHWECQRARRIDASSATSKPVARA